MDAPSNAHDPGEGRRCTVCGASFSGSRNAERCGDCIRLCRVKCPQCGTVFTSNKNARPGAGRMCGSCMSQKKRADVAPQAQSTRSELRAQRASNGRNTIKIAQDRAKTHPRTAKGSPDNYFSKIWHLVSPAGEHITIRNLRAFIAAHPNEFPSPNAARSAFIAINRTLSDPNSVRRRVYSCRGWTLDAPAEWPAQRIADTERRQRRERARTARDENDALQRTRNNIAALRRQANMTQAQLARMLGVSTSNVARWEHGEHVKNAPLKKIADIFGVDERTLLNRNELAVRESESNDEYEED